MLAHNPDSVAAPQEGRDRGQRSFARELGSAVEEAVASVLWKHVDSGVDKSLAWESIEDLAKSKLRSLSGGLAQSQGRPPGPDSCLSVLTSSLPNTHSDKVDWNVSLQETHVEEIDDFLDFGLQGVSEGTYTEGSFSFPNKPSPNTPSRTITASLPMSQEPCPGSDMATPEVLHSAIGSELAVLRPVLPNCQPTERPESRGTAPTCTSPRGIFEQKTVPRPMPAPSANSRLSSLPLVRCSEQRHLGVQQNHLEEAILHAPAKRSQRGRPSERPSCAYCKLQRKRCIGKSQGCDRCLGSRLYRNLCVPADFKESRSLAHSESLSSGQVLESNLFLPSDPLSPIKIDVSSGFQPSLEVELRPYAPSDQGALTHVLFRGLEGGMIAPKTESTAFSLQPGTLTNEKLDRYCDDLAFKLVLSEASQTTERGRLLDLVRLALRFWAMQVVFFKHPWTIARGGSRVGMFPLEIPGFWFGKTLLPRLVNQELDSALEQRMDELERELLERLQSMVFRRHQDNWCAIFLTSFILLHSLERDSWNMHAWEYEKNRPGGTPWPLQKDPRDYRQQNSHIASTVTKYFRIVSKGHTPFALDWTKSLNRELLNENPHAQCFVSNIQKELADPRSGKSCSPLGTFGA
ncbi:hypothetical protein AK830_g10293 [Neonectria ditissima]|uniref:Zn(2)-C6 fungal-type domain-containing protein n=1 Tax=Neonectria ditissima TaxID=78410 RepID=A0A0P7B415_9HYPO|nr:hypothetical protein AK830_g10293 [Neonectria ditissima]